MKAKDVLKAFYEGFIYWGYNIPVDEAVKFQKEKEKEDKMFIPYPILINIKEVKR